MSEYELKTQITELQDALQQALDAGLVYKANAEEGAARVEKADRRIYELERNRELFQKQRDEAIKERDLARKITDAAMAKCSISLVIQKVEPKPGDLFILRLEQEADKTELEVFSTLLRYLTRRYQQNTFISFAKGVDVKLEQISETELRTMGLISARRVDAGVAQLEAAFGTQQAALKRCRAFIDQMIADQDIDAAWSAEAPKLVEALDAILKAELVPDKRPDLRPLLERARACLGQCFEGDGGPSSAELELASEIDAALGEGT